MCNKKSLILPSAGATGIGVWATYNEGACQSLRSQGRSAAGPWLWSKRNHLPVFETHNWPVLPCNSWFSAALMEWPKQCSYIYWFDWRLEKLLIVRVSLYTRTANEKKFKLVHQWSIVSLRVTRRSVNCKQFVRYDRQNFLWSGLRLHG